MNNNTQKNIIFALIIFLLFILIFLGISLYFISSNEDNANIGFLPTQTSDIDPNGNNVAGTVIPEELTLENILKKHNTEYISDELNKVYVIFGEDLYSKDGRSNEQYFVDIVEDIEQFYEKSTFRIVDEEKNIEILASYNYEKDDYEIIFNGIDDFYKKTNGRNYVEVDEVSIIEPSVLFISNGYLERLVLKSMYFSAIQDYLTESIELDDGYISYPEERLKVKLAPNKTVQNIVFFKEYDGKILSNIDMTMSLEEIYELHPDNSSGSVNEGYLGYRNGDLYYFFYKDEVSVYGYSYSKNENFEKILSNYIEDKDLDNFVENLKSKLKVYDEFEYDPEIKRLYMTFPTRGIEIDIWDNNPKGITLYSNYYFTNTTKKLVKDGIIDLNSKEDLVLKYEKNRRENR